MKRIALLIPVQSGNSMRLLRGIYAYARPGKPWLFRNGAFTPSHLGSDKWEAVASWKPDGVIAYVPNPESAATAHRVGCPTISVTLSYADPLIPRIGADDTAVGQLAAEHLLEQGFRSFACVEREPGQLIGEARIGGFVQRITAAGYDCPVYCPAELGHEPAHHLLWGGIDKPLVDWLGQLPRPVGIFCWRDQHAHLYCEICNRNNLRVPDDFAIIGVDNDDMFCEMTRPTLSSVAIAWEQIGMEAARSLEKLMAGKKLPSTQRVMPHGVVTRESTDRIAVPDDAVAEALRYIRGRLADIRSVDDVVRAAGVGRRTLESRFHACMGRTILQEIHRMRLRQARQLLNSGDLSIEQIGAACGFGTTKQFREVFKRETGQSPGEYSARQRQSKPLQGGARSG